MAAKQNWKRDDGKLDIYFMDTSVLSGGNPAGVRGDYDQFEIEFEKKFGEQSLNQVLTAHHNDEVKLEPYQVPSRYMLKKSHKAAFPYGMTILNGMKVVNHNVKALIERLDPDINQFFPISFTNKDGTPVEDRLFVFVVTEAKPTVHPEDVAINEGVYTSMDGRDLPYRTLNTQAFSEARPLNVLASATSGRHIWRDSEFRRHIFVSHVFRDEIRAMKARFFRTFACQTVDKERLPL